MTALLVTLAGAAGVLLRYELTVLISSIWTVAAINLLGSFALGVLTQIGGPLTADVRTALAVGLIGGFTTLSTLTCQTVMEADEGRYGLAAAYLTVNVVGGLLCAVGGLALGRLLS